MARGAGDPRPALPYLTALELAGSTSASRLRAAEPTLRARYWEAVTVNDVPALRTLAQDEPRSYYGALARAKLPEGERPKPDPSPPLDLTALSIRAGALLDDPNFQSGVELLRVGLPSAAAEEFGRIDRSSLATPEGTEPLLLLAVSLAASGDARTAHAIAKTMLDGGSGVDATLLSPVLQQALWQVAYPNAFREAIERWAKAYDVPPDLMQALMREESALDPEVLSAAGAVGLTQLMPSTANLVAHKLGLGAVGAAELQTPETNIRLGTAYLGELLTRFHHQEVLAVAAYNAGEGAVDRWRQQRSAEETDAFVEDIPVAETRNYVKRVLSSEGTYRSLYGGSAPVAAR
jgi:soluble lytic murein transglycosylase